MRKDNSFTDYILLTKGADGINDAIWVLYHSLYTHFYEEVILIVFIGSPNVHQLLSGAKLHLVFNFNKFCF